MGQIELKAASNKCKYININNKMSQVRVLRKGIAPTIYYHQECRQCEALLEIKDEGTSKFKCPECEYNNVLDKNSEKIHKYEKDKIEINMKK